MPGGEGENYRLVELAREYREKNRKPTGVVLVWSGSVYGWKDKLRDARHERPGAIAVDPDGHVYQAQGGDEYNGAKHWVAV